MYARIGHGVVVCVERTRLPTAGEYCACHEAIAAQGRAQFCISEQATDMVWQLIIYGHRQATDCAFAMLA